MNANNYNEACSDCSTTDFNEWTSKLYIIKSTLLLFKRRSEGVGLYLYLYRNDTNFFIWLINYLINFFLLLFVSTPLLDIIIIIIKFLRTSKSYGCNVRMHGGAVRENTLVVRATVDSNLKRPRGPDESSVSRTRRAARSRPGAHWHCRHRFRRRSSRSRCFRNVNVRHVHSVFNIHVFGKQTQHGRTLVAVEVCTIIINCFFYIIRFMVIIYYMVVVKLNYI